MPARTPTVAKKLWTSVQKALSLWPRIPHKLHVHVKDRFSAVFLLVGLIAQALSCLLLRVLVHQHWGIAMGAGTTRRRQDTWQPAKRDQLKDASRQDSTFCLLYTSPSPRDGLLSRMPSSA